MQQCVSNAWRGRPVCGEMYGPNDGNKGLFGKYQKCEEASPVCFDVT